MNTQIIRCPVCLASQPVKKDISPNLQLHCGNCKHSFTVRNGLPLQEGEAINYASEASSIPVSVIDIQPGVRRNVLFTWVMGIMIWILVVSQVRPYMALLKGPGFLGFYLIVFIVIMVILIAMRSLWEDSAHVSIIALLIFESIGLVRFIDASAAGMHKFGFMFIMMGVGGVLCFLRAHHMDNVSWSGNDSSCSGSSSCGGCGGGGGCGGCGG